MISSNVFRIPVLMFGLFNLLVAAAWTDRAQARNIDQSECLPAGDEAANWPVKVIYMHGWFPPGARSGYYYELEADNRALLEKMARQGRYRIAVPVAQSKTKRGMRNWDDGNASLSRIEKAAQKACGGSALADKRALVGFSAGGYAARKIGCGGMNAQARRTYSSVIVLGAPSRNTRDCRASNMVYDNANHNSGVNRPSVKKTLGSLKGAPTAEAPDSQPEVAPTHYEDAPASSDGLMDI